MRVKSLLVAKIGRWLYSDAISVKSEQISSIISKIEESENKQSFMEDATSEGEYEDVSNSDSM